MHLKPKEIVAELNKYIIGQSEAKKAVAIALRNRWRRQNVNPELRHEITPKNILMIGPTGVGKTEIARRLAKLAEAPFIKVEATKFTEVGYVGRDVESIIKDLVEVAIKDSNLRAREEHKQQATEKAHERILDLLLPPARTANGDIVANTTDNSTREKFKQKLIASELDDKIIEIDLEVSQTPANYSGNPLMEDFSDQMQGLLSAINAKKTETHKMKIKDALPSLIESEASKLVDQEKTRMESIKAVEQNGIVFLDEIDKVAVRRGNDSSDVSRTGVQRDLLPIVEGTTVSTRHGMVKTDHILFIASGAFHVSKPSDLLPELQGRFPIRVELNALTQDDFKQILTSTESCLTMQYTELLKTEGLDINFTDDAINKIAEIAYYVNEKTENIGARRLATVTEKLLEDVLFDPDEYKSGQEQFNLAISSDMVVEKLGEISKSEDLSRYVL